MAVRTGEFLLVTETRGAASLMTRSGYSEFSGVVDVLKRRKLANQRFAAPSFAIEGRPLWVRKEQPAVPAAGLTALSPSDAGVTLAQRAIAELVPSPGEPKRRVRSPSPNRASVVLDFQVGSIRVLLGADLEKTSRPVDRLVADPGSASTGPTRLHRESKYPTMAPMTPTSSVFGTNCSSGGRLRFSLHSFRATSSCHETTTESGSWGELTMYSSRLRTLVADANTGRQSRRRFEREALSSMMRTSPWGTFGCGGVKAMTHGPSIRSGPQAVLGAPNDAALCRPMPLHDRRSGLRAHSSRQASCG